MSLYLDIQKTLGSFHLNVRLSGGNEVIGLLGASGCGKSMTLKCIAGVEKPDSGKIIVDGQTLFDSERHIDLPPQQRRVGLLFQNYALFPNMTARQNILTGLKRETDKTRRRERLQELIASFHLEGLEGHYPRHLSGGQQQRVALARILAGRPQLLMLDEPFAALDSFLSWQLEQELITLLETFSGTTLFVSHNRDEIYRLCQKACVINNGAAQALCDTKRLFAAPQTLSAALLSGCKNYAAAQAIDGRRLLAVDWGAELLCAEETAAAAHIGVRAHDLRPAEPDCRNAIPCTVQRITDSLFSSTVILHPDRAPDRRTVILWEADKAAVQSLRLGQKITMQIAAENILLLSDGP